LIENFAQFSPNVNAVQLTTPEYAFTTAAYSLFILVT
jgi:hypothetical protein